MLFLIVTLSTLSHSLAFPGYYHGINKLQSVPDKESYGKIQYPHFDIIEFGEIRKNDIPPKVIHEIKKILIKEPKPYPVKVPHPVPYPVIQKVPFHVVNQEIVKVPEPVPYPVIRTVSVPIEVAKPYPVPIKEFQDISSNGDSEGYGSYSSDINQLNDVQIDQSSYGQDNEGDQGSFQPLGVEQYNQFNSLTNYQENQDYSNQQNSDERPVYEDQMENRAS